MKAVMLSIQPKWIELIASGEKTVEVRKTKPKIDVPFKCYIYCTKGDPLMKTAGISCFIDKGYRQGENLYGLYELVNGKVIGEFVCDEIFPIRVFENGSIQDYVRHSMERSCVPYDDISAYIGKDKRGYGWHITDLVIYEQPKELSEFEKVCQNVTCSLCEYAVRKEGYLVNCDKRLKRPPQSWCYCMKILPPLVEPKGKTITIPRWRYNEHKGETE